ncbi:MAG: hypothetical protein KGJ57_18350 [Sphingomonadales bacterium]|nr:hypothetical protein [Sphingomonadales bacterium]MDE2171361.1 hypothetical protein [Sphingomonadales bacterium]
MRRLAFELACELRCTPKEAEYELRRRAAMAADRAAMERLAARENRPLPRPAYGPEREAPQQPWWMKD